MRAGIILLALTGIVQAHDIDRPDLDEWFKGLHNKNGALCCAMNEGNSVADADWESSNGHFRVKVGPDWLDVPDGTVIDVPNKDGRTIVWIIYINGQPTVRCFLPGPMT